MTLELGLECMKTRKIDLYSIVIIRPPGRWNRKPKKMRLQHKELSTRRLVKHMGDALHLNEWRSHHGCNVAEAQETTTRGKGYSSGVLDYL
jgi:hypothetical protein